MDEPSEPVLELDYPAPRTPGAGPSLGPTVGPGAPRRCVVHGQPLPADGRCGACLRAQADAALPVGLDARVFARRLALGLVATALVGVAVSGPGRRLLSGLDGDGGPLRSAAALTEAPLEQTMLTCSLENGPRRPGRLFIPEREDGERLSLVVAFHGSNGNGAGMVAQLEAHARARRFVIVAPDAAKDADGRGHNWSVGERPGEHTEDADHVHACIEDAVTLLGDALEPNGWLALGHSGGGSSAPFLATNDPRFGAFASLHGGVFETGLGSHRPRGWFSTGEGDSIRSPRHVEEQAGEASGVLGEPVVFRTFPGGHRMSTRELEAVFDFWLDAG